jgi:hypothetical protein
MKTISFADRDFMNQQTEENSRTKKEDYLL